VYGSGVKLGSIT